MARTKPDRLVVAAAGVACAEATEIQRQLAQSAALAVEALRSTVLPVTDGLVEGRYIFLDDNLEKQRAAAEQAADADIEAFANRLMSLFGPHEDDVAMIALRRAG